MKFQTVSCFNQNISIACFSYHVLKNAITHLKTGLNLELNIFNIDQDHFFLYYRFINTIFIYFIRNIFNI